MIENNHIKNSSKHQTSESSFDPRNYLDRLTPNPKEKNKYICPVCGGHNLEIDPKSGAYSCFNGCETKDIREAISPWAEKVKQSGYQPSDRKRVRNAPPLSTLNPIQGGSAVNKKSKLPQPCLIPSDPIDLAVLPKIPSDIPQLINESIPDFVIEKCEVPANAKVKTYQYSQTQLIKRYQWDDESNSKGYNKTIRPWHLNDGQLKIGKGTQEWEPYRLNEAATNGQGKWVIGVEGENGVEDTRSLGLAAVTWQGASWSEVELGTGLSLLKKAGVKGMVFISDNDDTGEKKAKALLYVSGKVKFPVLIIPSSKLWEDCPPKGDISDWIQWGKAQGMNDREFIRKLEEEIHKAVAERQKQQASKAYEDLPKQERLKLDIKAYLATPDIFNKVTMKSDICSSYRIKDKEFKLLCEHLEKQTGTPKKNKFKFNEFLDMESEGLRWVIPGLLPLGETILLAAQAKTGKSLLATDIAYSVLSGDRTIGELPGVTGKVLLVSSDESPNSTKRRLKTRGFDLLPESYENLRIMTDLDLANLGELEEELEDFKPQLVVIDSLTSISRDIGVSENDAEYAKGIYRLKEVIGRYGASGILIHHENKDKDAKGLAKVAGSARIVAATWGIAQLVSAKPDDDNCKQRWLKIKPREGEAVTLSLEINPKDTWASHGIFNFLGEFGDENGEKRTHGERVLDLLKKFSPKGLEFKEIDNYLNIGRSLYTILDRLEDRQLITKRRSEVNKRSWVYALPGCTTNDDHTTDNGVENIGDTPPPSLSSPPNVENSESSNIQALEVSQHQVNTELTPSQQPEKLENLLNCENIDNTDVVEEEEVIQHQPDTQGERVSVESVESENVVQENVEIKYENIDFGDIISETNTHMERLEWTVEQGQEYLVNTYGKHSRQLLRDKELLEFREYLKNKDVPFKVGDRVSITKPEYLGMLGKILTSEYSLLGLPTWWYQIELENGKVLEEKINVNFLEPISG